MTDPQDPLPEGKFFWRRLFSYVVCLILLGLTGYVVHELDGDAAHTEVARWLIGLNALVITYYMIAPSAEQLARIIQAARVMRAAAQRTGQVPDVPPPVGSGTSPEPEIDFEEQRR